MTILSLRNSVNHAPLRRGVLLIALTLASFALSSTARAQLLTSEMAGGGSVFQGTVRITHGFEVHCGTDANPSSITNNLDINWGRTRRDIISSSTPFSYQRIVFTIRILAPTLLPHSSTPL